MYMHKLVGLMKDKKLSQKVAADALDITDVTLRRHIQKGTFSLIQAKQLADLLDVKTPEEFCDIFFELKVN